MKNILGLQDLGRLYYKVLRDVEGTIVLSVINHVHFPKSVSVFNLRWMPVTKLDKKANLANSFRPNLSDVLIASVLVSFTLYFWYNLIFYESPACELHNNVLFLAVDSLFVF